jgi:predicted porin
MNKKLVALAVAGVFALPMAAQAQTANVTIYGRLNMDVEVVNGKQANGSNPAVVRVSSNSSRFGIRGTESLGGGLNAIFQIESAVPGDGGNQTVNCTYTAQNASPTGATGGGTLSTGAACPNSSFATGTPAGFATRETFVGLQGSWGTFKLGRFLSPYDDIHPIFGNVPTLTTSILSTASLWAQGAVGQPENGGFDDRLRNSIRYDSPNVSGFTGSLQYATYENLPSPSAHAAIWSVGGYYTNGPWQAGVAYEYHKDVRYNGLNDWGFTAALSYNFGVARVAAVYERLDYDACVIVPANGLCLANTSGSLTRNLWGIGVTVPAGPGTIYGSFQQSLNVNGSAATGVRVGNLIRNDNTAAQHWSLSYTYPMSKRTLTYVGWSYIRNESNGVQTFNINPYAVGAGGDPQGFLAGLVHFF